MFSIAIIIFREVLEITLILGVLLASTKGLRQRAPWVWLGLFLGAVGAGVVAFFADAISQAAQGMGQEMMNASILMIAAILIGWTLVWMNKSAGQLTQHFKEVGTAVIKGQKPKYMLTVVVALAVLREGSEIVMFLYSSLVTGGRMNTLILGALVGIGMGIVAGVVIYYGLLKIPIKKILAVTSWLLMLLVAGMVAQAFGYLAAAGWVPELMPMVWDTSRFISEGSLLGKVMHVLVGYTDRPSGVEVLVYVITVGGLYVAVKRAGQPFIPPVQKCMALMMVGVIGLLGLSCPAFAGKKVFEPYAEQGEWEAETTGVYAMDPAKSKNAVQEYRYALGHGVNSFWHTEVELEAERESTDESITRFKLTHMEWENIFQLTQKGEYWLNPGIYLAYEAPLSHHQTGQFEGKILLEKNFQRVSHLLNISFNKEVGGGAFRHVDGGISWSTRYRLVKYFEPGFEYWNDFSAMTHQLAYAQQSHQVGPCFYGRILGRIKYDIGYLFGISDEAPRGELKWVMEYEF